MKTLFQKASAENTINAFLILLFAVAALSSAAKDLDRLHQFTVSAVEVGSELLSATATTADAKNSLPPATPRVAMLPREISNADEFRWTGRVAAGQALEIKGLNGDIDAQPASGDQIEVVANKKARRSDPAEVRMQVVEHAGGVTICALYPTEDGSQPNVCTPGSSEGRSNVNVRNNDVRVDFKVRVPAGVQFVGRTVNGEISARSLASNVESRTVNGSINISTTGYAQAKTVNGQIAATLGNANWPGSLEFKTVNGEISVNLPPSLSAELKADTFNGGITSDFPFALSRTVSTKHLDGTIGSGGRELIIKTLNGSINVRRGN